ncbi:hypothetical protein [uncultured Agrococcus sp.]|nr:hypothetical protein [uncultured Agrococcus sp.]
MKAEQQEIFKGLADVPDEYTAVVRSPTSSSSARASTRTSIALLGPRTS